MKRKRTPSTPSEPHIILHEVCCAQCRARITVRQQDHTIVVKIVGNNAKDVATSILKISKIVRITVDDHNCAFHMKVKGKATTTTEFPVRSALSDWKALAVHGLIQVSRDTIINIAHVETVTKDRIYLNCLDMGVAVTKSYADGVSQALKFWYNIDYRFSC